ncbi:PIN domain-containing protein [Algoriphagus aestuariicola]|uniref:Ribonuclease VapC n=1 Tax=Algoriphagus aestuariicola TaxID=1852016 RepID=A0ABS3BXP3_9BACT|nr:PIN domain-containing protein [Algoriphagus aestuariicola]
MRVLIDTSAWIHFFRDSNPAIREKVRKLLLEDKAVICPIILQEILQGMGTDDEVQRISHFFNFLPQLKVDPYVVAFGAAEVYRNCRKMGITVRKSQDCQIAFFANLEGTPLLHDDRDFLNIGKVIDLQFY